MHPFFKNFIADEKIPLLLAPMEDVTDRSFRLLCKRFGADIVYTEFVNSDALMRQVEHSKQKMRFEEAERPLGIQIYGSSIEAMEEAARMAARQNPDIVDINFGCPVKKIAGRGAGSGMMREPDKMVAITERVVRAVEEESGGRIPVTVKTRLGWDEEQKNIMDLAPRLQDVGVSALTIHGRTRAQMYKGQADWTLIGRIKNDVRVSIPIIGNGDIDGPFRAKDYLDRYGVDALMVGRATYGRPWIFREIFHYLSTGDLMVQPSVDERVDIAIDHLRLSVASKGERVGVLELRRHLGCYFRGFPDFKPYRLRLVTEPFADGVLSILEEVRGRYRGYDCGGLVPVGPWVAGAGAL